MRPRPCARPPSSTSRRATGCCSRSCSRPSTPRTRAKARESAVDFEDLQLLAGSARRDEAARTDLRLRFRSIMVDEFQDTNRLQCELVDIVAGSPGDPGGPVPGSSSSATSSSRSIASGTRTSTSSGSGVPRRRPPRADDELPLQTGGAWRRQPSLRSRVRRALRPLEAGRLFPEPLGAPAVEVLVTDKASYRDAEIGWRVAEARHVARRVHELVAEGGAHRAMSRSCSRRGRAPRRTSRRSGRRSSDAPCDRPRLLRPAAGRRPAGLPAASPQPLRRRALLTVLASPLVEVSNDALVLLRRSAGKRPSTAVSSRSCRRACRSAIGAGCRRSGSATSGSPALVGYSLEHLCDRIVAEHDYDLRARALGRPAAVREPGKLARLAQSRGAPRPRSRGVRPLRPRSAARRRGRSRPCPRRRAPKRCGADDSRGEGPRVPGCRRVRRRPHVRPGSAGRDPGLPDGPPRDQVADPASGKRVGSSATTTFAKPSARRRKPRYVASTTSR